MNTTRNIRDNEVADDNRRSLGTVNSIYRYPIKDFPAEILSTVEIQLGCGLPGDRQWAIKTAQ